MVSTVMVPVIPKVEFSIKPVDTGDVFSCVRLAQVRSAEMDHRAGFRRAHRISLPHPPIRSCPSGRLIWTHQNVGRRSFDEPRYRRYLTPCTTNNVDVCFL